MLAVAFFVMQSAAFVWDRGPDLMTAASAALVKPVADGTTISGFHRVVRYTADEEENLINAAALALPRGYAEGISASGYIVKDLTTGSTVLKSKM